MGEILARKEGKKMRADNNKIKDQTSNDLIDMSLERAHQILKKDGVNARLRNFLKRNGKLSDIAIIAEKNGGLWWNKDALNDLASMLVDQNQVMKLARSFERDVWLEVHFPRNSGHTEELGYNITL